MKTTARLAHQKVRFDQERETHLVITLTAPRTDWQRTRPPVCVLPVIDVSGSMAGAKLHQAKQSMAKLVDHLQPGDFCGLVTFTDEVRTISPPVEMTQARKDALKAAVGQLGPLGSTNFAGGMLRGLELANASALPDGMLVRVVMFTDGLANVGVATTSAQILQLLASNLGRATVSAFGYGHDADQELLRDLAARGKGNFAFVESPEDALTAFARELGGLLSTHAQEIDLTVTPHGSHDLLSVLSDVDSTPQGRSVLLKVSDLLAEETRHLVLAVKLAAQPARRHEPVHAFEVRGRYAELDGSGRVRRVEVEVAAEAWFVAPGEEQQEPDADLDAIVAQAELIRAQIDAEELARRGSFGEASERLRALRTDLVRRGHVGVARACARLVASVADASSYAESRAYRASMRWGLDREQAVALHQEALHDLVGMGKQMSTEAQDRMAESFREGPESPRPRRKAGGSARRAPRSKLARKRSGRW